MSYTRAFSDSTYFPAYSRVSPAMAVNRGVARTLVGSRTGERVLDWREKIKRGENASSPFISDRSKFQNVRSSGAHVASYKYLSQPDKVYTEEYAGFYPAPPSIIDHLTGTSLALADSAALSEIYKKMNSGLSHMNAPAVLLEFAGVVRQFGAPAKAIIDLTNRHLNRVYLQTRGIKAINKNYERWHKIVAASYLEYSFGLQPLISDTKKAAETLARWEYEASGESRFRSRVVGRGNSTKAVVTETMAVLSGTVLRARVAKSTNTETRVQYVCGLSPAPVADFGTNDRLAQLFGFRPESWIPAVWEAVPWSWLADYFTTIQEILQALEGSAISPTWIVRTESTVTTHKVQTIVDGPATRAGILGYSAVPVTVPSGELCSYEVVRNTVRRTIPAALKLPTLSFRLPTATKQLFNMAAVLIGRKPPPGALRLF